MPRLHRPVLFILTAVMMLGGCAQPDPTATPASPSATPTPTHSPTATAVITPSATPIRSELVDPHDVVMVLIPAGEFTMGGDDGFPDELPIHQVTLDAYYIDKLEVTNQQYAACVEAGACALPLRTDCCSMDQLVPRPVYYGSPEFADYPVTWLSWEQGKAYCDWRGARLPTEAEWEKAARGTDARTFPWGDEAPMPNRLNFAWEQGEFAGKPPYGTSRVGDYPLGVSPYGVLDMAGNVYEWVSDVYDPGYYAVSPAKNPAGPTEGKYRIARGGSFFNGSFRNRSSNRNFDAFLPADRAEFDAGVRCAVGIER